MFPSYLFPFPWDVGFYLQGIIVTFCAICLLDHDLSKKNYPLIYEEKNINLIMVFWCSLQKAEGVLLGTTFFEFCSQAFSHFRATYLSFAFLGSIVSWLLGTTLSDGHGFPTDSLSSSHSTRHILSSKTLNTLPYSSNIQIYCILINTSTHKIVQYSLYQIIILF